MFPWRFPKADFPSGLSIDDCALQCGSQMCPHPKTVKETGWVTISTALTTAWLIWSTWRMQACRRALFGSHIPSCIYSREVRFESSKLWDTPWCTCVFPNSCGGPYYYPSPIHHFAPRPGISCFLLPIPTAANCSSPLYTLSGWKPSFQGTLHPSCHMLMSPVLTELQLEMSNPGNILFHVLVLEIP